MSYFFQVNQSKMAQFGLLEIYEFSRSKHIYWMVINFWRGFLYVLIWQCNDCSFTVVNMIQENFNILSLTNHNVKRIIVIIQRLIGSTLDDDGLMRIELPFIKFSAGSFNQFHFGQVIKTELWEVMNDDAENVGDKSLVKEWFGLIFLEFKWEIKYFVDQWSLNGLIFPVNLSVKSFFLMEVNKFADDTFCFIINKVQRHDITAMVKIVNDLRLFGRNFRFVFNIAGWIDCLGP